MMDKRLIGKCPYCNGLFEANDLKEDHAKCQWCGNELGTVEYVEISDDRSALIELMKDREQLSDLGVDNAKNLGVLFTFALSLVPFIYFAYGKIAGEEIKWYIYLLMAISVFILFGMLMVYKDGEKKYKELKKLVERHNYSLINLSSEISHLKELSDLILAQDSTSSKGGLYRDMAEILKKLIPYIISQGSVRERYAEGRINGTEETLSDRESMEADYGNAELIYIIPPSQCPACNHIYKQDELKGLYITCPHCSLVIRTVDESVRTESGVMIRDFLLRAAESDSKAIKTAKQMKYAGLSLAIVCAIMMATMGIERFFFSWAVALWFPIPFSMIITLRQTSVLRMLKSKAKRGVPDLFELELLANHCAVFIKDEFIVLKAEIIKKLKK